MNILAPLAVLVAAQVPPGVLDPFHESRFLGHVEYLASDRLEGRDVGTRGGALAAEFIIEKFRGMGLEPGGDDGTFLQPFPAGEQLTARNIIGKLPGRGALAGEAIIVAAHYDHVGRRVDEADPDAADTIYNGADDNASGVAALLLMAEHLSGVADKRTGPARTVLFISFDAEERGLLGARYYIEHPRWPLERTTAVLNFDMVGRLRQDTIYAGDAESSRVLADCIRAAAAEVGLVAETRFGGAARSDNAPFLEHRIPGTHFNTGIHAEYHQVNDESPLIHAAGGARVTRLGALVAERLMTIDGGLEFQPPNPVFDIQHALALIAKLGIVPNQNAQAGRYPEILFVVPGSLAARQGIQSGDQVTAFNGVRFTRVEDALAVFAQLNLREDMRLTLLRDREPVEVTIPARSFEDMIGPKPARLENGKYEVVFRFRGPGATTVHLAGSFNAWDPAALKMDGPDERGDFTRRMVLEPGVYEYKFVVDGDQWHPDPKNFHQVGPHRNSVLWVGEDAR